MFKKPRNFLLILIFAMNLITSYSSTAAVVMKLRNSENSLEFRLLLDAGKPQYEVDAVSPDGLQTVIIEPSPLGLVGDDEAFLDALTFVGSTSVRQITDDYTLLCGKKRQVRNRALEQSGDFVTRNGPLFRITVRMMQDAVAFRYEFPDDGNGSLRLTGEATGFKLPTPGAAWMLPYDHVDVWAPSYEAPWQNRVPIGKTVEQGAAGWSFPAVFHVNDHWIMITEAGMDGSCYAAHLEGEAPDGLYKIRLPEDAETYGVAEKEATIRLPWKSPWRAVVVGKTPGTIIETNITTDLSAPNKLDDVSWIIPGRVSWSWWSDKGSPYDYNRLVPFVDMAADFGWEYSLVDLGWEDMQNGSIEKLIDYAHGRGVGLILWYNSGGPHNEVYAGLRDIMHDPEKRVAELKKLQEWGVKGSKVDFMQSDKQAIIQLYIDILRDAAKYRIMVDFHGSTMPRGWARTFPNLMTMEGIRGAEQYWDEVFAENAHTYHTIYPFTRNAVGSMDYTPVVFGFAPELQMHKTTNSHELATAVIFESGFQHYVDSVSAYRSQPDFVRKMLSAIPVVWDETRYLGGIPGEMVLLARRSGEDWFVACLNGETREKPVTVSLDFLTCDLFQAEIIMDGPAQNKYEHKELTVTQGQKLDLNLQGRGGFTIHLRPSSD